MISVTIHSLIDSVPPPPHTKLDGLIEPGPALQIWSFYFPFPGLSPCDLIEVKVP